MEEVVVKDPEINVEEVGVEDPGIDVKEYTRKMEPRNQEQELETVVTQESMWMYQMQGSEDYFADHWLYALKNKCVFRDVLKVVRDSESRIDRGS